MLMNSTLIQTCDQQWMHCKHVADQNKPTDTVGTQINHINEYIVPYICCLATGHYSDFQGHHDLV